MLPQLERTGPYPIYQQIKDWMRQQITAGIWPEHFQLKAEIDLADEMDVSRGTVRKAIEELIAEGLLVRIHGRGTYVASRAVEQPLAERLIGMSEDLISRNIPFETRVIEQSVIEAPERIQSLLSLGPQGRVFLLRRVRYVAQGPLVLLHNYVVYDRCPGIEEVDFEEYRLFQTIEGRYGLKLDWGLRTFEAQSADDYKAQHLDISECDPVMYLQQIVYLNDGSPIELSDVWFRADRFKLTATVKRNGPPDTGVTSLKYP
jgi:DNA-binding GntR family transcriptional regulator